MNDTLSIHLISDVLADRAFTYKRIRTNGITYRLFTKGSKVWVTHHWYVHYPFVSSTVAFLCAQKDLAYDYVTSQGYIVPETVVCKQGEEVDFDTLGVSFPVVVKPNSGAGSVGVTRDIMGTDELAAAVAAVHRTGSDALVQRQFNGQEIRLTVLDGVVVSACLRAVPQLVGDGTHTIAELLAAENQERAQLTLPYMSYPQLTSELVILPQDMNRIPAVNEVIKLGESTMISGGASVYPIDEVVHASYKDIAVDLAAKLRTEFLVVDLLVSDYRQMATADNYVFLEFNTAPALKFYYSFRTGEPFDILPLLADKIETTI